MPSGRGVSAADGEAAKSNAGSRNESYDWNSRRLVRYIVDRARQLCTHLCRHCPLVCFIRAVQPPPLVMSAAASSAVPAPSRWHHPHQSCGAYTGPLDAVKPAATLDPAWRHCVLPTAPDYSSLAPMVQRIFDGVAVHQKGYERLETLCTEFGARLSGSNTLERAIDWTEQTMREDGLENVRTEEVMVPNCTSQTHRSERWAGKATHCNSSARSLLVAPPALQGCAVPLNARFK
jgi:hypothetical protein